MSVRSIFYCIDEYERKMIELIRNPSDFKAVEQFYQEFRPISDGQIIEIVKRNLSS
jgi:predicted phosphoribosyltransferase